MNFFHPLRLGRRVRVVRRDDREDDRKAPAGRRIAHEAWREGVPRVEWEYQEFREADELDALRRAAAGEAPRGVRMILGEPGAGKSTLLGEWFRRWAADLPAPRLGTPVPVLVRLAALNSWGALPSGDALADRLWEQGCAAVRSHLPEAVCAAFYQPRRGRLFRPVWLLDGLDEVAEDRVAAGLVDGLAGLPGLVAVTCRTAVFQQRHRDDARFVRDESEILPLTPGERLTFLTRTFPNDEARARDLAERIAANTQLAHLAGNPLMLDLIADVSTEVPLPATRAAFYAAAVRRLWQRRCPTVPKTLAAPRDRLLTALAAEMRLDRLDLPEERFIALAEGAAGDRADALIEAVYDSGLVHRSATLATVQFRHLTFQEYHLARMLSPAPVRDTLFAHWTDPRYDETLALLLAMRCDDGRATEADAALLALVDWGLETYKRSPEEVFALERSPMRSVLHLIRRTGVGLERLPLTRGRVRGLTKRSFLLVAAFARDPQAPPAGCPDKYAFRLPATPPNTLAANAAYDTRRTAAENPATPPDTLATLAADRDYGVRRMAARNPATPPGALAILAAELDGDIRSFAAGNPATPPDALAILAADLNNYVRRAAAGNPSATPDALATLAADPDYEVRVGVAGNPATPSSALAAFVKDPNNYVRRAAAGNPATSPVLLAALAADPDWSVRQSAAENPAIWFESLAWKG